MKNYFLIFISCLFMLSCKKDAPIEPVQKDKYFELAYDQTFRFPDGFNIEKDLMGSRYYLNTVSIKAENRQENSWLELNTNDLEQAKTWSDISDEHSSVHREIIKENHTERYFEFVRAINNDIILSRVHRSDYFVPFHDKFTEIDTVGIYNGTLLPHKVKELIDYLWDAGCLGISDSKVVETTFLQSDDVLEYHIESIQIVYGDFGMHDIIHVYSNKFQLDKSTRHLTVRRIKLKEVQGK